MLAVLASFIAEFRYALLNTLNFQTNLLTGSVTYSSLNKTINITKQYINFKIKNYLIDIIDSIPNQNNLDNQLINFINKKYSTPVL